MTVVAFLLVHEKCKKKNKNLISNSAVPMPVVLPQLDMHEQLEPETVRQVAGNRKSGKM